uniref:cAMP-dependent protein kinase inhibitor beta n=2 Tax=Anatinae TaxID=2068716 RepID=A0A8C0A1B3_9AVES
MTDVEPLVTDFAASGRSGRRNALPDILGSPAGAGTSDLPHKLAELSVSEGNACTSQNLISDACEKRIIGCL